MRGRIAVVVALCAVLLAGCGGSETTTRVVLVDHDLDAFPTSYFGYFPRVVEAHPGDTIKFQQTWTGEPHTVTLGTSVERLGETMKPFLLRHRPYNEVDPSEYGLPSIFAESDSSTDVDANQVASQPCYVGAGAVPSNFKECAKTQPDFDGDQTFYNSGYIRYRGRRSNRFSVPLAPSIKPGEYFYYCLLHGPGMGGFINVKPKSASLHSISPLQDPDLKAATIGARAARAAAVAGDGRLPGADVQVGTFSLAVKAGEEYPVSVNEFMPSTLHAKVGQKVVWSLTDGPGHTVSFAVPSYLPAIEFKKDGTVHVNPVTLHPVGGPGYPGGEAPKDGFAVDVGNYDGRRFLSSGYPDGLMRYSITFTKPGTYPYACLIHPLMLGRVVVEG